MSSDAAGEGAPAPLAPNTDPGAILDAWRARGEQGLDPVRFRFIEALARRASTHRGEARRILDDKVNRLLAAYGEDLARCACTNTTASRPGQAPRGVLAELVDHLARHSSSDGNGPLTSDVALGLSSLPELKTLSYFRSTWSRLSANRRLRQSLATMPENAGPLNSQHLVHRSLTLMRELSPEYLHRFMSYVDALWWVDQANGGAAPASSDPQRAEGRRSLTPPRPPPRTKKGPAPAPRPAPTAAAPRAKSR